MDNGSPYPDYGPDEIEWDTIMTETMTYTTEELDALSSTIANGKRIVKFGACFVDVDYNVVYKNSCTQKYIVKEDPLLSYQRLLIEFRDDPCRDPSTADESCQNYTAPEETNTTEEEEETSEATDGVTIAQSDKILVSVALATSVSIIAIIALIK